MDEVPTRKHAEAHAKAVVDGDMDAVTADFVPELRGQIQEIAQNLPQPTTEADVRKVEMEEDHAIVEIRYANDETSVTLRSRWEEHDGRPMIVGAAPADED
jgi:hypothetical protein